MKKISLFALVCALFFSSCKLDEGEIMSAYVYFPLATWADSDGVFQAKFNFEPDLNQIVHDTTYIVGAYCSGNTLPQKDIHVQMELALDALSANPALAHYTLLPEGTYTVEPANLACTIKKGTERADIKVHFHLSMLDPDEIYILPLRINSVSAYEIAAKNHTLFFGIQKIN